MSKILDSEPLALEYIHRNSEEALSTNYILFDWQCNGDKMDKKYNDLT